MAERIAEIESEISEILARPLPPPSEKHLVREALYSLHSERLRLAGLTDAVAIDLAARRFAVEKCPQRLQSYPMHLREKVMSLNPNFLQEYASRPKQPAMSAEEKLRQQQKLFSIFD